MVTVASVPDIEVMVTVVVVLSFEVENAVVVPGLKTVAVVVVVLSFEVVIAVIFPGSAWAAHRMVLGKNVLNHNCPWAVKSVVQVL